MARLKGLVTSSWVVVGNATRVRTREMDRVIQSRPRPRSLSRRNLRASWNAPVDLSSACRTEIAWWLQNLCRPGDTTPPVPGADRQPRVRGRQRHGGRRRALGGRAGGGVLVGHSGPAPCGPRGNVPRRARGASPPGDRVHDSLPRTGAGR